MKATDIFNDEKFIKCLKKWTFDEKGNRIKIFNRKGEIIEENVDKVIKIDCSDYWITSIEGISIFKNLKKLYLSINKIEKLPKEIWNLKKLEELFLNNNKINELSSEIGKLKKLKILDLSNNQIKKLPEEIWNLKKLEILKLSYNKIKEIPKEIWKLKNLEILNLDWNQLQWLSIKVLGFNKLQQIWLYYAFDLNNLKQDSKNLLDILKKLKDNNVFDDFDLYYLKTKVYPVLAEKIKEKYKITDLKNFKDNFNLDNLTF